LKKLFKVDLFWRFYSDKQDRYLFHFYGLMSTGIDIVSILLKVNFVYRENSLACNILLSPTEWWPVSISPAKISFQNNIS